MHVLRRRLGLALAAIVAANLRKSPRQEPVCPGESQVESTERS